MYAKLIDGQIDHIISENPPGIRAEHLKDEGYYAIRWKEQPTMEVDEALEEAPYDLWPIDHDNGEVEQQWVIRKKSAEEQAEDYYQAQAFKRARAHEKFHEATVVTHVDIWEELDQAHRDAWKAYRQELLAIMRTPIEQQDPVAPLPQPPDDAGFDLSEIDY